MLRSFVVALATVAFCSLFASAARAEMIENPGYKFWSAFNVGTTVTMKGTTDAGAQKMDMNSVSKLIERTDDKLTIELTSNVTVNGQTQTAPSQKIEIKKMVDKAEAAQSGKALDPEALAKAPEESVTVAAGTFKAKKIEMTRQQGAMTLKITTWFCEEVPGGTVKSHMVGEGQMKLNTSMELVSFDKK